jgi:hypothetical protein
MKTINLQNTKIQSIIINALSEDDSRKDGFVCNVTYAVCDDSGEVALHSSSQKFTIETENATSLLSADSSKAVTDFVSAMQSNMNAKEEL